MRNSERLNKALRPAFGGPEPVIDDGTLDRLVTAIGPLSSEDFTCGMIAMDVAQEFEGPEGVKSAWRDWIEAYSELRFRIGKITDVGENVLMLADQIAVTRHGGVEVEQPSAAVWMFRDGQLFRVEFHLDRRRAERVAQSGQE